MEQQGWAALSALWLYAAAARINKPPSAATCAQLTAILRHCRAVLDQNKDLFNDTVPQICVIMSVAGAYFRQDESMVGLCPDDLD